MKVDFKKTKVKTRLGDRALLINKLLGKGNIYVLLSVIS